MPERRFHASFVRFDAGVHLGVAQSRGAIRQWSSRAAGEVHILAGHLKQNGILRFLIQQRFSKALTLLASLLSVMTWPLSTWIRL
jgi:hypothetical protein